MAPSSVPQRSLFADSSDGLKIPTPKPEDIRHRLLGTLRLLREAETFPWSPRELRTWRIIFPQMTDWLPNDEAKDLKDAFVRAIDGWGDEARDTDEA